MEQSLRAYIVFTRIESVRSVGLRSMPIQVKIVFANTGQTPAVDVFLECHVGASTVPQSGLPLSCWHERSMKRMKGVIGHNQNVEIEFFLDGDLLAAHSEALHNVSEALQVNGTIKYRDVVAGHDRETNFNWIWRGDVGEFFPDDKLGNSIT